MRTDIDRRKLCVEAEPGRLSGLRHHVVYREGYRWEAALAKINGRQTYLGVNRTMTEVSTTRPDQLGRRALWHRVGVPNQARRQGRIDVLRAANRDDRRLEALRRRRVVLAVEGRDCREIGVSASLASRQNRLEPSRGKARRAAAGVDRDRLAHRSTGEAAPTDEPALRHRRG